MSDLLPRAGGAGSNATSVTVGRTEATAPPLKDLLKAVSRSFYLTLRMLPRALRPQIGLAYLLARATDTVADTDVLPVERRLDCLHAMQARIAGTSHEPFHLHAWSPSNPSERELLERSEELYSLLATFHPADQEKIRRVLETITSGQILDLHRFGYASANSVVALASAEELDDYTFRVAGCVGQFWTEMCGVHLLSGVSLDDAAHVRDGIRFGKGLQLINILRDVPGDLRQGRCYFPVSELAAVGLTPQQLLDPSSCAAFRPVYTRWLQKAQDHLAAGWNYTNALPWRRVRLRLACAWPILIGLATLRALETGNVLEPGTRIKIGRAEVKRIIFRTLVRYPWPAAWRRMGQMA